MHNKSVLDRKVFQEVLDWLSPLDYGSRHSDHLRRRQPGTVQWLLDSVKYRTWLGTRQQTLFCLGMPGAGKTILTAAVIDDLEQKFQDDNTSAIAYVYFNYMLKDAEDAQKLEELMASLLKQVVQVGSSSLSATTIKQLHNRHAHKRTRPTLDEISRALLSVITEYSRVFIVVDALDECQTSDGCQARFVSMLFDLQAQSKINIFATSREIPDISEKFKDSPSIQVRASDADIRKYLEGHISELRVVATEQNGLKDQIIWQIIEAAQGI